MTLPVNPMRTSEVVLVNGPPGVGKSTVSRLLFTRCPGAVWIRGDDVRAFAPADAQVHLGPGSTHRAVGALAAAYVAMGARRILVDYCFLNRTHVSRLVGVLDPSVSVHLVTLWAPLAVIQDRERNRMGREPLGGAVEECYREIEAESSFAVRVETDSVQPSDVADAVDRLIATGVVRWNARGDELVLPYVQQ